MSDRPKVAQLHATRGGEFVTMIQREIPEAGLTHEFLLAMRDEIKEHVEAKGGADQLTLHTEDSDGFWWAVEGSAREVEAP